MTDTPLPPGLSNDELDELDELDQILTDLGQRVEEIPQWEFCDGFLTALVHVVQADHAGPAQRGIEHRVVTQWRAAVRKDRARGVGVAAGLDQQHRLDARCAAQRAHEATGVADAFDVEEDALGTRVRDHVFEHLAEVDVGRGAQRHHRREADVVRLGPVEDGCAQRARLRDQADAALERTGVGEGGVDAELRAHDAQAVGAEQADAVAVGGLDDLALEQRAARTRFGEARRQQDGGLDARTSAAVHDRRGLSAHTAITTRSRRCGTSSTDL